MNRRTMCSTMAAGVLTVALAPSVGAGASWCENDPPINIVTPGGAKVVLHATNYGELTGNAKTDLAIRKAVRDALVYHTVLSATNSVGQPDTLVTVKVTVPEISVGGPFATRMIISTKPRGKGDVTAQEGFDSTILSGQQMMVQFLLGKA